jgi:molybdate transport system substrate-binding protein
MATQIVEGESADIFISAHPKYMADLKQRGLIDVYSLTNLVGNSLVLAASKKIALNRRYLEGKDAATILNNIKNRAIPVIADPAEVPLGIYTQESLQSLKLWDIFNTRVIRTENARAALYLIAKGETLGVTYFTDAYNNPEVDILAKIPDDLHEPIIYQAAVVAGENMPRARDFLTFLQSKEAKRVFAKYQFVVESW